jgi:hypothetical protein
VRPEVVAAGKQSVAVTIRCGAPGV